MAPRFLTILIGRNLPKIGQPSEPERSIITETTIAEFTQVVEQTGISVAQSKIALVEGLARMPDPLPG